MFGVVCFRCDGDFDHSQGFDTVEAALAYALAGIKSGDGCTYQIWNNGVRVA
jgi:hypothetical protein